jgi:hypothetical protein
LVDEDGVGGVVDALRIASDRLDVVRLPHAEELWACPDQVDELGQEMALFAVLGDRARCIALWIDRNGQNANLLALSAEIAPRRIEVRCDQRADVGTMRVDEGD